MREGPTEATSAQGVRKSAPCRAFVRAGAIVVAMILGLAGCSSPPEADAVPLRPEQPLVSARSLAATIRRGDAPRLIDTRPAELHRAGHVPGAISLPLEELQPLPVDSLDGDLRQGLLRAVKRAGIRPDQAVVVVDEGSRTGLARAATLCWLLALVDCERCGLLEGGTEAWARDFGALETRVLPPPNNGRLGRAPVSPPEFADFESARLATFDPAIALVDVRAQEIGAGVPGASRLPLDAIVTARGTVDAGMLHELATQAGLLLERRSIVIGEDSTEGALGWFLTARSLGIAGVSLFPGGLSRWREARYLPGAASAERDAPANEESGDASARDLAQTR